MKKEKTMYFLSHFMPISPSKKNSDEKQSVSIKKKKKCWLDLFKQASELPAGSMNYQSGSLTFYRKSNQLELKSFIDGAADCFDNRRDVERVTSPILLLANCRLVIKFLYLCP